MIFEEKAALRRECKSLRKTLFSKERNEAIFRNFLASPYFQKNSFFVFLSVGAEAETSEIISALLSADKQVLVPRIVGGVMRAVPYSKDLELFCGIPQPKTGEDHVAEVALTPLLAFDEEGYRLGYGGGYYDKYFASHPKVLRVGLAFAGQARAHIAHEAHDMRLHAIVTERGCYDFT